MPSSRTLACLIDEQAERYSSREAVVGDSQRLTYSDLKRRVLTAADRLHALGVHPGDKVGILMGNRPEWIISALAITRLGAVAVALNTWAAPAELAYLLRHSDAVYLIAAPTFRKYNYAAMLRDMGTFTGSFPRLEGILGIGNSMPEDWLPLFDGSPDSALAADPGKRARLVNPSDIAFLVYTSGSTSTPKGVQLDHRGLIENIWNIGERQHVSENDRLWLAVSLFWGFGCANAMVNLLTHGGCIVLQESFDAGQALELIERERCTLYYGTPNMSQALYDHPDRQLRDLSSLRGGATIGTPQQIRRVIQLGATQICNVYGLTETYGNSHVTDASDGLEHRLSCVGKPLPGVEQRIVDEDGKDQPCGQVGEIRLKGHITPGYYKDPALTANSFDERGFFRTGDLGLVDAEGNLYLRGRIKEMIKTGGINVSPAEVEAVLMGYPGVSIALVVGVPDPNRDEVLAAIIVAEAQTQLSADVIIQHCRERVAAYKVPRIVKFVSESELPLTNTGKIQKNRLASVFFPPMDS